MALFLGGAALGLALGLTLMGALGHLDLFVASVRTYLGLSLASSTDPSFTHGLPGLFWLFLKDHFYAICLAEGAVVLVGLIAFATARVRANLVRYLLILAMSILFARLLYSRDAWKWVYPGLLYLALALPLLGIAKVTAEYRLLASIALVVLVVAPLGSDNGIRNAIFGMWLAGPLALLSLLKASPITLSGSIDGRSLTIRVSGDQIRVAGLLLCSTTVVLSLYTAWVYAYRDTARRLDMRYGVDHPMLRGVYTTERRAQAVGELLQQMATYVRPGDLLLAAGAIPLVHFVTETRPYAYNSWPELYVPSMFDAALKRALREQPYLPVVVRATVRTTDFEWPVAQSAAAASGQPSERRITVERFLDEQGYHKAWENGSFEIWIPPQGKGVPH